MPGEYDKQLLESVAVRRRRVRDALLFGARRSRRTLDEHLTKLFAGFVIAALLSAGCVGWSFLQHQLQKQRAEQNRINHPPTVTKYKTQTQTPEQTPSGIVTTIPPSQLTPTDRQPTSQNTSAPAGTSEPETSRP